MLPGKCAECGIGIGFHYIMTKGEEIKLDVCPSCKEKLMKQGWKVSSQGVH